MTKQEIQERLDAATKSCKKQGLIPSECDKDSFLIIGLTLHHNLIAIR